VPLYPVVPLLGIAGGSFLMVATITEAPQKALLGIGLTLLGLPFYYWSKHRQSAGAGG
jgi:APA family basic amino acid/polyamine antiporter